MKPLENGKADHLDVFIFHPQTRSDSARPMLSGVINSRPDAERKPVRCRWPGGHSGALYQETVDQWTGKEFHLAYSARQTDQMIDGKIIYVRVETKLENGIPLITKVEHVSPSGEKITDPPRSEKTPPATPVATPGR